MMICTSNLLFVAISRAGNLWRFWLLWASLLLLHVFVMWWIFDKILPANHMWGTMYVIPLGFVEAILLVGLIVRIERMLDTRPRVKTMQGRPANFGVNDARLCALGSNCEIYYTGWQAASGTQDCDLKLQKEG